MGSEREHLETLVSGLERPHHSGRDPDDVEFLHLDDLVVELYSPGS